MKKKRFLTRPIAFVVTKGDDRLAIEISTMEIEKNSDHELLIRTKVYDALEWLERRKRHVACLASECTA